MPAKKIQNPQGRAKNAVAPTPTRFRHAWRIAALWILALAAYSNSFDAALVFDNASIIGHDPRIREASTAAAARIFTSGYWYDNPDSGLYRPLTTLSYLFNYAILGEGPDVPGYHAVNLALHGLNIALVYALGTVLLPEGAFAIAAIWAVHPLLTESVTNIVGRADLLAGFGVLAGLLCYLRSISAAGNRKIAWLAALMAAQAIGLFSKESGAILPAAMLLYDVAWPRTESWRSRVLPYLATAVPFGVFFLLRAQLHSQLVIPSSENPLAAAGFWTAKITAVQVIGKFLWLFIWPARLTADYSFNAVPLFGWKPWTWPDAQAVIAFAICATMATLAIRWRRRNPPLFFFLGFFFIALAPTANILLTIGSIMAERFMYLPAVGLAGCLVIAVREIKVQPSWKWVAASIVCLAFGLRTYARNADWHDSASLWTSAIDAYPDSARPHNNLGSLLLQRSDVANAIPQFEAALRIRPDYAEAHANLGIALAQIPGRLPEAIFQYQAALRDRPDYAPKTHLTNVHVDLGNALARMPGRTQDAIAQYESALNLSPDNAEAHYNFGNMLAATPDRIPDAIVEWQAATRLDPTLAKAHYNLATVYSRSPEHFADAVAEYQEALRLRPDYPEAHNNLASVLSMMPGRLPEAIDQYRQAIRLRPDFAEAHYNLAMALLKVPGSESGAMAELETALRLKPDPRGQEMLEQLRHRLH